MKSLTARIVVLNYNGVDLLEKYMPSILEAAEASSYPCKVTVLDNCSQDGSVEFLKTRFPKADISIAKANLVLCSYNEAVRAMTDDVVILLNNDMSIDRGHVDALMKPFTQDDDVFFVAPYGNRSLAKFRWGILDADVDYPDAHRFTREDGYSFSAGVAAFDRKKFLELDGYDTLYLPGRYEDLDLCFRGWKRGWKGTCVASATHWHEGGTSFSRAFTWKATQAMVFRNSILFMFKNITDPFIFARFLLMLPVRLLFVTMTGRWFVWRGFFSVFPRLGQALRSRKQAKPHFHKSDRSVISLVNNSTVMNKKVYRMKSIVDALRKHKWMQGPFFFIGFWTVRLIMPVQYFLLKELVNCDSVLDLGCGRHSMVPIIPSQIRTTGVELHESAFNEAVSKGRHWAYVHGDVTKVEFPDKSFDAVVLLDVIEHLSKDDGLKLITKMKRWAKKKIIVFTPNGFLHQHEYDENPLMEHLSGWSVTDFKQSSFGVYGVGGFKFLKPEDFNDERKPGFVDYVIDLSQAYTYFQPETAFQLFCVYRVSD